MEVTGSVPHHTPLLGPSNEMKNMSAERKSVTFEPEADVEVEGTIEPITARSWTERRTVQRQYLSTAEAASLIVNKMIGTGIFTTPGLVLSLTHNKWLALGMWIAGGFYAALCLLVYLDFGTALPFNGAELIYLNRVFSYERFKLLPPVLYAAYFVCLYHTAGNALAFARFVIIADVPNPPSDNPRYNLSFTLVKALAVLTLGVVCFLLWVHPRTGLILSKTFAAFKLMLLFVLGFWGMAARHKNPSTKEGQGISYPTQDWGTQGNTNVDSISHIAGFIYVAYSYGGWESACYVLGQFDKSDRHWMSKIRYGAFSAVILVALAYTVLVIGFYESCFYEDITSNEAEGDLGIARLFADKIFNSADAIKVCIAISGFGNLIAVAYTSTKVKQAIALHHFLPYSDFLGSEAPFDTPTGALLLHWIISSIFILATPADANGYGFLIGLLQYGQLVVAALVGLGRFKLDKAVKHANLDFKWTSLIPGKTINYFAGFLLCVVNILLCIASVWPATTQQTGSDAKPDPNAIPAYLWAVVVFSCVLGGLVYWYVLLGLQGSLGDRLGWKFSISKTEEENDLDRYRRWTRRDGTEERYRVEELRESSIAYKVKRGWTWFWRKLELVL